jgi:hypothetical protein
MRSLIGAALGCVLLLAASAALGGRSEQEIARLGGAELTPVGAQRAGNADGTIPEWKGVTAPPPGWKPGDPRIDLFADDKVLFTIDASNVDKYADKLSAGQIALIKAYEGYKMDVYPTRRSCALPQANYESAKVNARIAKVDSDCLLEEGIRSPLFPLPETGCEAIQNGKNSPFNGIAGFERYETTLIPTKGGSFEPVRRGYKQYDPTELPERYPTLASLDGVWAKSLSNNVAPPKQAGEITLGYQLSDGHLLAWTYNPGQRRVRRNPTFEYDNPIPGWQGLVTIDQVNGFVGAADRYDWKLVGKRELYIPYNNHKLMDHHLKDEDLLQSRYPRRDVIRYELHRVWVVEGTVRADRRHTIPRRVFHMDEDSWAIAVVDMYDTRGQLWRVSEHAPQLLYEVPTCMNQVSIYYDLVAGRYALSPAINEEERETDYLAGRKGLITEEGFNPDDIRRAGRR